MIFLSFFNVELHNIFFLLMLKSFSIHCLLSAPLITDAIEVNDNEIVIEAPEDYNNFHKKMSKNIDTITIRNGPLQQFYGFNLTCNLKLSSSIITEIPDYFFFANKCLKKLEIFSPIRTIGISAFANSSISIVTFHNNLESLEINGWAFYNCYNLEEINLSGHVQVGFNSFANSGIKSCKIGSSQYSISFEAACFENCTRLTEVTILANDFNIPSRMFYNCINLQTINHYGQFQYLNIYDAAFANTGPLSLNIKVEASAHIYDFAFYGSRITKFNCSSNRGFSILDSSFMNCNDLVIVECSLGSSVESSYLGKYSFKNCNRLKTFKLHDCSYIGAGCFQNCYNLRAVDLGNTNNNIEISNHAFHNCYNLISVTSSKINVVGDFAFYSCKNLTTLNLEETITIGKFSFAYASIFDGLHKCIVKEYSLFNSGITTITITNENRDPCQYACLCCSNLVTVTLQSFDAVFQGMFKNCTKLNAITIEQPLRTIGEYAFAGTTALKNIVIQSSDVVYIHNFAFYTSGISSITFDGDFKFTSNSVPCPDAFAGCGDITITLGQNVHKTDFVGFSKSHSLTFVIQNDFRQSNTQEGNILYDAGGKISHIKLDDSTESFTVNSDVSSGAFSQAKKLKEIIVNNPVDDFAFYGCESLEKVKFTHTSISRYCFYGCNKLKELILEHPTYINDYSFAGCISLQFDMKKVQSIGRNAFERCVGITSINLDECTGDIGSHAFYKCTKLSGVSNIHSSALGDYAFSYTNIESIDISKVVSIDQGVFANCSRLKKVILNYIQTIPQSFFEGTNLTTIDYPDSLNSIDEMAFAFSNLKVFVISDNINSIAPTSFRGCESIKLYFKSCNHPRFIIGAHELIDATNNQLILTYGKIPSTYVLPDNVQVLGPSSIQSVVKYNEEGKVIDFGVTTLVIPGGIAVVHDDPDLGDKSALKYCPYLYNLCYGGSNLPRGLVSDTIHRYFVSDNFASYGFWYNDVNSAYETYKVIRGKCDSSTPYKSLSKGDYFAQPSAPQVLKILPVYRQIISYEDCSIDRIWPLYELDSRDDPQMNSSSSETESKFDETETQTNVVSESTTTLSSDFIVPSDDQDKKTPSKTLIILIVIAGLEIIAISSLIMIILHKKREESSDESTYEMNMETAITTLTDTTGLTNDNPLFNQSIEDDPFKQDFEDDGDFPESDIGIIDHQDDEI